LVLVTIVSMMLLSLLLVASLFSSTIAGPNGASGCMGGIPAVGGAHLREGAVNGSLAEGGVSVDIGNVTMQVGDTFEAMPFDSFDLTVTAGDAPIRGILVRLECQTDLTGALSSEDPLLQEAQACEQDDNFVVGMTHTSNVDKGVITMVIGLGTVTTVSVDVTVVMANDNGGSMFYYDRFFFAAKYPPCNICGDLGNVQNPTGIIAIPPGILPDIDLESIDCETAAQFALAGQLSPEVCGLTPTLAAGVCQCGIGDGNMTVTPSGTMPPSDDTDTTMTPTISPTSSAMRFGGSLLPVVAFSLFLAMA
jgi:hypothetical protein